MKKNILTLIALATVLFSACKKDNNNNGPSGDGSYQPFTTGSTWSYRSEATVGESVADTSVNTMTATTKTFDGKTFHLVTTVSEEGNTEGYIGYNNKVYSTRSTEDGETVEIAYLDENRAAGETWTTPIEIQGTEARIKNTLAEKGVNKVILGKTYNNVIHTTIETQVKDGANFKTVGAADFYVAKGVGIIAIYTSLNGEQVSKTELISAHIK